MENEMIQRSVPNEPLEGMPEEYEDPELLEEEVGESEGIVIENGFLFLDFASQWRRLAGKASQ